MPQIDAEPARRGCHVLAVRLALLGRVAAVDEDRDAHEAGRASFSNSSHFGNISVDAPTVNPVRLPPGRARLATHPPATGSSPAIMTIGIVDVAALAARTATAPGATITSTLCLTRSAA